MAPSGSHANGTSPSAHSYSQWWSLSDFLPDTAYHAATPAPTTKPVALAATPQAHPHPGQPAMVDDSGARSGMDRVQIQNSIRSLSAAVAQLPATEEHDQTCHFLNVRIAEH